MQKWQKRICVCLLLWLSLVSHGAWASDSERFYFRKTEIPIDQLLTKRGIIKFVPAAADTAMTMFAAPLYGNRVDLIKHDMYNYVIAWTLDKVTGEKHPILVSIVTAGTFTILKEGYHDKYLGKGTPDAMDALANTVGASRAMLGKERKIGRTDRVDIRTTRLRKDYEIDLASGRRLVERSITIKDRLLDIYVEGSK